LWLTSFHDQDPGLPPFICPGYFGRTPPNRYPSIPGRLSFYFPTPSVLSLFFSPYWHLSYASPHDKIRSLPTLPFWLFPISLWTPSLTGPCALRVQMFLFPLDFPHPVYFITPVLCLTTSLYRPLSPSSSRQPPVFPQDSVDF